MSVFRLYVTPPAWDELQRLPGHMKHRVRSAIDNLASNSYPPNSKQLDHPGGAALMLLRLRIDKWRIVYVVDTENLLISIVGVRKRPPYDYQDLAAILENVL